MPTFAVPHQGMARVPKWEHIDRACDEPCPETPSGRQSTSQPGTHSMHLNELKALHVSEVLKQAEELEIENTGRMRKQELMFAIIKKRDRKSVV